MILMYHKVDKEAKTRFWVSVQDFERQMAELSDKQVVSLDDYDPFNPNHIVITFDGVYENVYTFAFPILKKLGYPYHLFITSDFIGKDNSFDTVEPLTTFATFEQLQEMADNGASMEWHTKTHRSFGCHMTEKEIIEEITIPTELKALQPNGFNWFAYPYGHLPSDKIHLISERFNGAVSVLQGSKDNQYKLNRLEVHNEHTFSSENIFFKNLTNNGLISVIVPTYNVSAYIRDFFHSILSQSYTNLEIIIVNDASTDASLEIARYYAKQDKRIKILENKENLGVGKTLARGYAVATGDFCATMSPDDTIDMFYFENLIKKYQETKSEVICARMLATQKNYMYCDNGEFTFYPFAGKIGALFYFYPALVLRKMIVENDIWNSSVTERHWEDILIRCKYAYHANHVSFTPKAIRYYTIRSTSLSHAPSKIQLKYQKAAEKRVTEFLESVRIDDIHIKLAGGFKINGAWDIHSWFQPSKEKKKKFSHKMKKFFKNLLKLP